MLVVLKLSQCLTCSLEFVEHQISDISRTYCDGGMNPLY